MRQHGIGLRWSAAAEEQKNDCYAADDGTKSAFSGEYARPE
jgi:hypothetical protein